jgi:oligopeptide/dipeptide ABC transporter ATP-binding protein
VPHIGDWPRGCRFANRCSFVTAECRADPVELSLAGDHWARCIHADEIPQLELKAVR